MSPIVIVVVVIVVGFFIYVVLKATKDERKENREIAERLDDENLYDPETGAILTMEQAESGHYLNEEIENRTITENDKAYLNESQLAALEVETYLSDKYQLIEDLSDSMIDSINKSEVFKSYNNLEIAGIYKVSDKISIGLIQTEQEESTYSPSGPSRYSNVQPYIFLLQSGLNTIGHALLLPNNSSLDWLGSKVAGDFKSIGNYKYTSIDNNNILQEWQSIIDSLSNTKDLQIEFLDDFLLIKMTNAPTIDRLKSLIELQPAIGKGTIANNG